MCIRDRDIWWSVCHVKIAVKFTSGNVVGAIKSAKNMRNTSFWRCRSYRVTVKHIDGKSKLNNTLKWLQLLIWLICPVSVCYTVLLGQKLYCCCFSVYSQLSTSHYVLQYSVQLQVCTLSSCWTHCPMIVSHKITLCSRCSGNNLKISVLSYFSAQWLSLREYTRFGFYDYKEFSLVRVLFVFFCIGLTVLVRFPSLIVM